MPGVFLSYRRKDGDFAVLLYAWLVERFGADRVFWDREDIDPGSDFREVLSGTLASCDALVALIGPAWSPSPWIQKEIGASLKRKILVLPVMLGDAARVEAESLPQPMRKFASLQTLETADLRFRDRLLKALDAVVPTATRAETPAAGDAVPELRARRLTDLLREQIDRRQRRALELIVRDEIDQALDLLNETFDLVMALIDFRPADRNLEMRLGYLYKDLAQVFDGRDRARFNRYIDSALQTFQRLVELPLGDDDLASSWNGLGNMYLFREDFDKAVECCQRAVQIAPEYSYAWHDLFFGLEGQARNGKVNLPEMVRASERLKATGRGDPLLEEQVERVQAALREWQLAAKPARPPQRRSRARG